MRSHLRRLGVVLIEGIVILVVMTALYTVGHLVCYQELPRWK